MLVLSTKLYVKNELTDEKFIEMATTWVSWEQNYSFGKVEWDGSEEFIIENDMKTQKFSIMRYDNAVIVHLENVDGKVIWTNDFVLTKKEDKRTLAVLLYNDAVDMSVRLPQEFKRPFLLKQIIKGNYGAEDNNLPISDYPIVINESNIEVASRLILGKEEYLMPVVYVTPSLYASTLRIDCEELAKDLAGVAHVLIEESSEQTKKLREMTDGRNPYNGAVQIFYSPTITQRILPCGFKSKHEFRKEVAYSVFRKLVLGKIGDEFSWTKIRYNNLLDKSKESIELAEICNELLKDYEEKIEVGNQTIQELENKISHLQSKLQACEYRLKEKKGQGNVVMFEVQESDLYENEISDVILKVLEKEIHSMEDDVKLRESRKYHILQSLIQQNEQTETAIEITKILKTILNLDGSFNKAKRRQLNELGFDIEEGKHYKIIYRGDERYKITLPKTPSDYRSNINTVSDAANKMFGY